MKRIVEFPVSIGEKVIYLTSDAYIFKPYSKELFVVNYSYNKYHDIFCLILSEDSKALYGSEVPINNFGANMFLIEEKEKAKRILRKKVEKWKRKNTLKN